MDRRAWRATIHRVAKSRAQLKQLSMHTHTFQRGPGGFGKGPSTLVEEDSRLKRYVRPILKDFRHEVKFRVWTMQS